MVSSREESEDDDIAIIEDEDRELQAQIEKERKEKRAAKLKEKKEREGKPEKKKVTRKRKAAPKKTLTNRKKKSVESESEKSEESEDDEESEAEEDQEQQDSEDDSPKKKRPNRGVTKKVKAIVLSDSEESEPEVMPIKRTRKKIEIIKDSSEDDELPSSRSNNDTDSDGSIKLPSRTQAKSNKKELRPIEDDKKKKKRGLIDDDGLAKETVDAEKAEKERRKRLEQKQKEFNGIELEEGLDLTEALIGTSSQRKLKSVVVDPDNKSEEPEPVEVHPSIVRILKPHQAQGIQFMYDCAFESIDRLDTEGSGGILAHCMGLGKTLQVISFLHTVMMHPKVGEKAKHVLVVVPKNVIINWFKEFMKWLSDNDEELDTIDVTELDSAKTVEERQRALLNWHNSDTPSVMIIGYDMFRILTAEEDPKKKKSKVKKNRKFLKAQEDFRFCLQNPGPDLIVCDEAHKLKNDESALSKTMVKIRTKRRICLTGTPLQNNLMEYHCMVNFVKPGLLGTKGEFANRFVNIINRGRTKDASSAEVQFMKRRCHVLYEHLKKCVDRKDYRVLTEAIPPKQEYVLNVRMTDSQCKLYRAFLDNVVSGEGLSKRLLPDYHVLSRIWTHPYQLVLHEQKLERDRLLKEEEEEEADFIDDGSESESERSHDTTDSEFLASDSDDDRKKKKKNNVTKIDNKQASSSSRGARSGARNRRKVNSDDSDENEENDGDDGDDPAMKILLNGFRQSRRLAGDDPEFERDTETPPEYSGWFAKLGLLNEEDQCNFEMSNKLVLLCSIIKKCEEIGDKLLVFSQSLESLALIKRMLEYMAGTGQWFDDGHEALNAEGETWSWLEGQDYLTIDGSIAAGKRDAVQTHFNDADNHRARLMLISTRAGSLGTNMVSANRVVIFDACWNPSHDTQSLFRVYRFGQTKPVYIYRFIAQGTMEERIYKRQVTKESTSMRVVDEAQIQRHYDGHDLQELYQFNPVELKEEEDDEIEMVFAPPKDRLLAEVLLTNRAAVVDYFEHDTLFANQEEEKLTEEEMKDAWNDYEMDKRPPPQMPRFAGFGGMVGFTADRLMMELQQRNSQLNESQRLKTYMEDLVFSEAMKLSGMDHDVALRIVMLKNCLEEIMPYIPMNMRGGMHEFRSHFFKMIHEAINNRHPPHQLLKKSLDTFRTVVTMVSTVPSCRQVLQKLKIQYPYMFENIVLS
uniref:Uncharacterized protein n=1 Tax=Caenorhabditis angaria TaxID=860376 RepID=B6VBX9_9PELO|nr:hypothetical protein Csp3_JD05.007 [Caenorhabditis angaria]